MKQGRYIPLIAQVVSGPVVQMDQQRSLCPL